MSKFEMIKHLEYLIAFQANCLNDGDWKNFDLMEDLIKDMEIKILQSPQIVIN